MPDAKITQLTALTTAESADVLAIVDDPGGTPFTKKITTGNLIGSGLATITGLTAASSVSSDDILPVVDDPGGTPTAKKVTYADLLESVSGLTALSSASADDELLIIDDPGGTPTAKKITAGNLVTASGLVLLEQHTASSSASLDFTSWYSSSYDEYLIELIAVIPATDNVSLSMRMSTDGGSNYDSGNNYQYSFFYFSSVASGVGGSAATSSFLIAGTGVDNSANYGVNGSFRLFSPGSTSVYKALNGGASFMGNDTNRYRLESSLWYLSTTAVNAFRFLMSSGNIASGTIRVYGVSK